MITPFVHLILKSIFVYSYMKNVFPSNVNDYMDQVFVSISWQSFFLHAVIWYKVFLSNVNDYMYQVFVSISRQSFFCTQLYDIKYFCLM